MIENTELYREKGSYNHPQPQGLVVLKHYIFMRVDGRRTLILRFANESPFVVDGFDMVLTELDKYGKTIKTNRFSYLDTAIAVGGVYSPARAVVVSDECTDFKVQIVSVKSGTYSYTPRRGRIISHYDKQGKKSQKRRPKHGYTDVRSSRRSEGRTFAIIAAVAIILIGLTAATSRYRSRILAYNCDADTVTCAADVRVTNSTLE